MAKSPRKTDVVLPLGLSEEQVDRARHAAEFPPNTPHSVINHFYGKEHDTLALPEMADPRKLDAKKTAFGLDVVESAPGVMPTPFEVKAPRKMRSRKSRKVAKPAPEATPTTEAPKT